MPAWGIHLAIAKKLNESLNVKKNEFIFGNILPDVNNGYLIKDVSNLKTYEETHYYKTQEIKGQKENLPDIYSFLGDYKDKMNNSIVLGYFAHLLSDYFWNKNFYLNYCIVNDNKERIGVIKNTKEKLFCDKEEIRKFKVGDFDLLAHTFYKENKLELPIIDDSLLLEIEKLECVKINKLDLKKIKDYLENEQNQNKNKILNRQYQVYTKEEIQKEFEDCIKFILEFINKYFKIY